MENGYHLAEPRRRRRARIDADLKTPVQPVSAVTGSSEDLRTRGITTDLPVANAPLPVPVREENGRFKRGAPSPNPGGRPAIAPEVRDAARAYTAEMLSVLVNVALDESAPAAARVTAATAVLDRGHGKPVTNVDARIATMDVGAMHLAALEELARGPMALSRQETVLLGAAGTV